MVFHLLTIRYCLPVTLTLTQTVAFHPGLHFPSSIALITHTAATNQTHFISHGLPLSDRRELFSMYRSPSDSYITEPFRVF